MGVKPARVFGHPIDPDSIFVLLQRRGDADEKSLGEVSLNGVLTIGRIVS